MTLTKKDAAIIIESLVLRAVHVQSQANICSSTESKAVLLSSHSNLLALVVDFARNSLVNDRVSIGNESKNLIKTSLIHLIREGEGYDDQEKKEIKNILKNF